MTIFTSVSIAGATRVYHRSRKFTLEVIYDRRDDPRIEIECWLDCGMQRRTSPGVQWCLARAFIARTNSAICRRPAIASAV
jgi:hypothetical protein